MIAQCHYTLISQAFLGPTVLFLRMCGQIDENDAFMAAKWIRRRIHLSALMPSLTSIQFGAHIMVFTKAQQAQQL